ncbi:MAG: site-specific integrase [Candidatus Bathyarchaeia archaeon]
MENLSNVQTWIMKCCGPRSQETYRKEIRNFRNFILARGVDVETLKDEYRKAKYAGEMEKEKFLDQIHDLVEVYGCHIKTLAYSSMHEALILSVIRSYLVKGCGMKDVEVTLPKHVFVKYHNRDLKKEDIRKIVDHATLRDRTFFLMMAESGMRPETLCELSYADIKEEFESGKVPMKVELPSLILKDNPSARFTFIGEDSLHFLKEYLAGKKLSDKDLIFSAIRPASLTANLRPSAFSSSFGRIATQTGLAERGKKGERKAPRPIRLYGLRKYFNNNMRTDRAYVEFWLGHTDAKQHYVSNDVEEHRKRYSEGYPFLRVYESVIDNASIIEDQKKKINKLEELIVDISKQIVEQQKQIDRLAELDEKKT